MAERLTAQVVGPLVQHPLHGEHGPPIQPRRGPGRPPRRQQPLSTPPRPAAAPRPGPSWGGSKTRLPGAGLLSCTALRRQRKLKEPHASPPSPDSVSLSRNRKPRDSGPPRAEPMRRPRAEAGSIVPKFRGVWRRANVLFRELRRGPAYWPRAAGHCPWLGGAINASQWVAALAGPAPAEDQSEERFPRPAACGGEGAAS